MNTTQQILFGVFLVFLLTIGYFVSNILTLKTKGEELNWCLTVIRK